MKLEIEVADEAEGKAIELGLSDPVVRATVTICGSLLQLPDSKDRRDVLDRALKMLEAKPKK